MKQIAIYGAGGFGREVACLIQKINEKEKQWDFIGFFDDVKETGSKNEYGEILGGIEDANRYPTLLSLAIAIGNPKVVENILQKISNPDIDFPNLISPDVIFLDIDNLTIGRGNIISIGCVFSCNVTIGSFNIFNWKTTFGHDVRIGDFNAFMPAVNISGGVIIGDRNLFGVNSTVLQRIIIGNDTTLGANSLILRKTKDHMTYIGNPAKIINY